MLFLEGRIDRVISFKPTQAILAFDRQAETAMLRDVTWAMSCGKGYKVGPLPVMSRVMTSLIGVITPVANS